MKLALKIAAGAALMLAGACGERRAADGTTAEEREKLNRIAENLDAGAGEPEVVDTSADSLVVDDALSGAENGAAPVNGAARAPVNSVTGNGQ